MAQGDIQGRAFANPGSPRSKGVCDRCGDWVVHSRLREQLEFYGTQKKWTGYLVCSRCLDDPQPQLIPIILPPDPVPIWQPRPESFANDYRLGPFTQYLLFEPDQSEQTEAAILAQLALLSGIAIPGSRADYSGTLTNANISQTLMAPNAGRTWVAIYNPASPQLQVSLGTAAWGNPANLVIGQGQAILAATSGSVPTGQIAAIGLIPGVSFNAFAAPG